MKTKGKVVAGIDIGSSKIATIIAQVSLEEQRVNVIGASSIPSLGVRKGQIVNIEEASSAVINSVEAAERMAGYSLERVVVGVGGGHISSQNSHGVVAVAEPEGEIVPEDVRRVIEAAKAISLPSSREILHVIPRTYTVDSQEGVADPVGMSGVRLEVETHIISGSTTSIKNLVKCVSEVGVDIDALVFTGVAAAEAILNETEKELGVVLVDIGGGTTSLIIFQEGSPAYTAVLPIGAKNITNDLAIGLRLSLESAEKLKLALKEENGQDEIDLEKIGIVEAKSVSRKTVIEGIIKPRLNEIFNLVGAEIQKSGFAGLTPSGIVICGGGAMTVGAADVCKKVLALPVRIGYPTKISGLVDDITTPAFASSVGLILYADKQNYPAKFSFPKMGKIIEKIPVKSGFSKAIQLIKSFLP